ncbi:MAG: DUF1190 domain-containing protein [Hyphomicrobiales bacterium]|nr:DUF1190 domain-containing protein [Hyphomicrobiales bacterium]
MKRSEYIAIGAVGLLAVAAFWPRGQTHIGPGADDAVNPDAQAFASVDECRVATGMTPDICDRAFATAQQAALSNAPRFDSQTSCEGQFGAGQCRSTTWNGASVFVPVLVGALVARSLANAAQPQGQPLFPPRAGPANCPQGPNTPGQPECAPQSRSSGGAGGGGSFGRSYSTGSGTTVTRTGRPDGRVTVSSRAGGTVARSGFGSTGHAVSSGS